MSHTDGLLLDEPTRANLWQRLTHILENYLTTIEETRVAPELNPGRIRALLRSFDFAEPRDPLEALDFAARGLWEHQVHTPHPGYYGFFNPAPTTMGIAADALVAAFNPQMASWVHSPLAIEMEQHLVRAFAERFGYDRKDCDGVFASGGAEANHTALLTALTHAFPDFGTKGLRVLAGQPILYVSAEGHHSFLKAARLCGLGAEAVRAIPVKDDLQMDVAVLAEHIQQDRRVGHLPCFLVATAGTTSAGTIDPITELADIAAREKMWFHVDAAWGGAVALVPELRHLLAGIERADSITFDAHKWLSVPMGAGLYLTRHPHILDRTFRTATGYMPREDACLDVIDPYAHSMQWSRRFIGLKVFLSLAVAGWSGYAAAIRHMMGMGQLLRQELEQAGWRVVNPTPLPLACFVDQTHADGASVSYLEAIERHVLSIGKAWISTPRIRGSIPVLRACITNYRTEPSHIRTLIESLQAAREKVR